MDKMIKVVHLVFYDDSEFLCRDNDDGAAKIKALCAEKGKALLLLPPKEREEAAGVGLADMVVTNRFKMDEDKYLNAELVT